MDGVNSQLDQALKNLIVTINTKNVIPRIQALHASTNPTEVDVLIELLQASCLNKINFLEKVQFHLRGDRMPKNSRCAVGKNMSAGSVCNKKLTLTDNKEKVAALQALMAALVTRYNTAIHMKELGAKGKSFITFGISEYFQSHWDDSQTMEASIFYGATNDIGHNFTIVDYIDVPETGTILFEEKVENDFTHTPLAKTEGIRYLGNRKNYLAALMLASTILNSDTLTAKLNEIERKRADDERKQAERIALQQELSKISLQAVITSISPEASTEQRRNMILSYLRDRFDEYNLEGYSLIRLPSGNCRFIFPHGNTYLGTDFKATSAAIIPKESIRERQPTMDEIDDPNLANEIIAPILDEFIQLVINSENKQ